MFKVEVSELSNPQIKLLSNIQELLQENNNLLKQLNDVNNSNIPKNQINSTKPNIDTMDRKQIIEIIKTLPQGSIKGKYMTMSLEELRKNVKAVL